MDSNLRELIEMATVNGTISQEHEKLIIEKAMSQGISEAEIRLYIDSSLRKNNLPKKSNRSQTALIDNEKIDFKNLSLGDWIILAGIFIAAVSGFFPWFSAKGTGSGFGQSFSSGASTSVGFMYTIPIAISAFVVFYTKKLHKYLLYEGLGIIFVGISLYFYYTSSTSSSYGGASYKVSTSAGSGVLIMIVGGIIYTIGVLLRNKSGVDKNLVLKIFFHHLTRIIFLGLLLFIPLSFEWSGYMDKTEIFIALILFGVIPFWISKKSEYNKFYTVSIINVVFWIIALLTINNSENRILENLSTTFITIAPAYAIFNFIVGGLALVSDYYKIQQKEFGLESKISRLYNIKMILSVFLGIFLVLFTYNVSTKHRVSYEEMNAYTDRNGSARGDWYFLSEDSTSIYEMEINFYANSMSDNGEVTHKFSSSLYNSNISLEGINSQELEEVKDYDYTISYPISFDKGLKINAVEPDKLKGSFILKGNTINFEAYRDQSYVNSIIEQRNSRIANTSTYNDASSTFVNEEGVVITISPDLYMISDPDGFTNLRDNPDGNIMKQVYDSERFRIIDQNNEYYRVILNDGTIGYLHQSRVVRAELGEAK